LIRTTIIFLMIGHVVMVRRRIAILGGAGMLGTDLADECLRRSYDFSVFDLPCFDITDTISLEPVIRNYDIIVNCAAYTSVEKAESEPALAYKINAEAAGQLGRLAKNAGLWVLHISTDFVFDGQMDRPYIETDPPNPINAYGKSKLAGEQLLIESGCDNCIMRVQWTYGSGGNNFVKKLTSIAQKTGKLTVVDDQFGSPTATTEVAKAICDVIEKKPVGLFHFAADGYVSRFGMAGFMVEKLGWDVDLDSCKSSQFPAAAARPLNSCFNCAKIRELLTEPIRPWQGPLEEFIKRL